MTRSNGRLQGERDQDGAPPGGVRWSGVRPRPTVTLLEQLDQLERADPCRNIEDIWKRYRPAVWARLQRPTIPEDVAEDFLLEVFTTMELEILRKNKGIPPLPGRTLAAIATHLICNYVRVRRRQPSFVSPEALEAEPMPSSRSSPERVLQQARRNRFVWKILSLMDDDQSELMELVDLLGFTEVEVAADLGESVNTVRYRVNAARKRFRALAERHRAELGGEL